MKRILAMLLTVAMIATACPMVFADEVTEESNITVTENLSAEALEKEKNIEEAAEDPTAENAAENEATVQVGNISLFAAENEISLMSADEVQYSTDGSAWTSSTLADAVSAIGANTGTIKVTQNITLTATLNITGNITMVSDGTDVTIKRASTLTDSPMVEVKSGATLTLGTETPMLNTLTFDGGAVWSGDGYPLLSNNTVSNNSGVSSQQPIIDSAGTLLMYEKIILQNNYTLSQDVFTPVGGGALKTSGAFNMYGGEIINNYAEAGGGVIVCGSSQSEMNLAGGKIMNNAAELGGAVYLGENPGKASTNQVGHKLAMSGGIISGNSTGENSLFTGTVCVMYNSEFTMTGGEITGNKSVFGGGVGNYGKLNVTGGYIHDNTASGTSYGYALGGDDVWNYGEGASTGNSLSLPTKLVQSDASYTIKWYYDGCKAADISDRYSPETANEKTTLTADTEQCSLKAVYTEILPEAEYRYSYYDSTEGYVTKTKKGSFQDAVTAIKNSSNSGDIKILADSIDLKQTASFPQTTTITSDHDVTFTKGFTGGPMFELPSANSKNLVSFTADNGYNITIVGADDGDNPVFSMPTSSTGRKLDLTNVTIKDNTVSGNGGAIRLTNNAGVKLTNVTIQNCSAGGFGGAVYHEDCGNNVGGVYCENVTFKNNKAKGGSAIYVDGVTGMSTDEYKGLTINGCTFTGNSSTKETASTPAEAVKLDNVIYVDCISGSFNQSVAAELKNTNTFTGNTTYSDINLGSNMATMSNLNKSILLTDFSLSTDREGGKLKVVVGSYSVNKTAGTYVFYASGLTTDQLNTMAEKFSLTADKSGNGTVLGNKAILPSGSYALVVKEPAPQRIRFNLNSNDINTCSIEGETVTYLDDRGNALSQGSFSMSSVEGPEYAITATPGHTVTFTANLNAGYQVKAVAVTGASGSTVSVTKVDDTKYTFVMPNEAVTVYATVSKSSSITVVQPESGSITVTVPDMTMVDDKFTAVEDGTTVTLSATGDDFGKWSITNAGGTDVTSNLMYPTTNKNTSFTMPPYDITITAKVKHDITVNATGGTYKVSCYNNLNTEISKAAINDMIWVGLTPNTNYKLTGVEIKDTGGETIRYTIYDNANNKMTDLPSEGCKVYFKMPDKAVTINVTFELDACEITASATNGTISGITSPAPIGSAVNFTLTPEDDTYELGSYKVFKTGDESTTVSVTDNGDGTYTFTMPEYPVTVSASFIKKTHDVTITKDGEGTVSISPETPVTVGETVTVAATPDENWELSTLTMNGTDITSTKSFTMPNEAVSIHAVFVKKKFAVTVDVTEEHSENGAVVCEVNGTDVEWGTEVNFTVEPNQYYDVDTVTVNGMTVTPGEDGKYKFDAAAQENKISATFKKQQFKLKDNTPAVDTSKGTVAIIKDAANVNDTKLDWGTRVTVTVTPEENWEIDTVKINGKDISEFENDVLHETMRTFSLMSVSSAKTYTVLIPTYDAELVVTYKKSQFTVTKSATENGTISIIEPVPDAEGNIKLDWDETVKINVTPDSHYDIDTVTVDGTVVAVDAQGDYSFTMPTHDVTISATFKKTKYSIIGTGDHVTFDIPNTSAYDWGDTVEFTATPDQWYNIRSVTADNATVTITKVPDTDNTYSFTMPSGNITITAVTERPNFSVTFASNGGSSVAAKVVANGDAVAKPEVPVWAGRGFAGWYLDEECTQKYDFTQPVTGNLELYARWFLWGDVNNDGVADSYDALLIRRCRVGLTDYSMITNRMAGFVNGFEEGRRYPDSGDAVSIRRYRVGLISRYKVEDSAAGYEYDLENDTYISNN